MSIPEGITREHVLQARTLLDEGALDQFAPSSTYDVLIEGRKYPPKALISLAAEWQRETD